MVRNMTQTLELYARFPTMEIHWGSPYPVTVRLQNTGSSAVLVNPRMAVGYYGHLAREIFVQMTTESGKAAQIHKDDYNRDFLQSDEYIQLKPGETISTTFDFFEWYLPKQPGLYTLVFHYQADEELADPPEGVIEGLVSSVPYQVNILPPSREGQQ